MHEPPFNVLSVIRWRSDIYNSRRRDARHLAMADVVGVPRDDIAHASGSALPEVVTTSRESTSYASEAASLHWLPHLSSLHSRFIHPSGRRDMKEWHITAQVLKDYVLHRNTPIVQNQSSPASQGNRSIASTPPLLPPPSREPGPHGASSLEIQRLDPATELESFSSPEHESGDGRSRSTKDAVSPNTSVKGYRISLTGLGAARNPRKALSKSSRPTSPSEGGPASPLNATEFSFSPSSSRRDLSTKRAGGPLNDDPLSSEMSMSEGATDMDGAFRLARQDMQTTSEEDPRLKIDGTSPKPKWARPIFSRKNTGKRVAMPESASSPVTAPDEAVEDSGRPAPETHSFTADFLGQFPRAPYPDQRLASLHWEETQRIRRDRYARQEV